MYPRFMNIMKFLVAFDNHLGAVYENNKMVTITNEKQKFTFEITFMLLFLLLTNHSCIYSLKAPKIIQISILHYFTWLSQWL